MSWWSWELVNNELSRRTPIFGLHVWVLIAGGVSVILFISVFCLLVSLRCRSRRPGSNTDEINNRSNQNKSKADGNKPLKQHLHDPTPPISKEISVLEHHHRIDIDKPSQAAAVVVPPTLLSPLATETRTTSGSTRSTEPVSPVPTVPEVSHLGWGRWYTLRELQEATGGLADENIIGEGGYGVVYLGELADGTLIAVKNLINNRGQAEKEFKGEVEVIGRVRHKNLVRLIGYCVEGSYRMLVYEYVDNGNLDQWLHRDVREVSPLTWEIRMNIILGAARGLAYLHEGLEPKVVHRDVKSSNILLDQQWNPKVSDFGLAKLLCSERSYVTTRVMGTFGYVAPEYASTGMLNETSDVYSFGVLIMEIITGRTPVDYTRPPGEVNLVEWLKTMVGERKSEQIVDPRMQENPSSKALKRAILVALRCVDPDASKRPKMAHIIHMLEADDLLSRDVLDQKKIQEKTSYQQQKSTNRHLKVK